MLEIPTTCPACGTVNDVASVVSGRPTDQWAPGAVAICVECEAVNIVSKQLHLRRPTLTELTAINRDPRMSIVRVGLALTKAAQAKLN